MVGISFKHGGGPTRNSGVTTSKNPLRTAIKVIQDAIVIRRYRRRELIIGVSLGNDRGSRVCYRSTGGSRSSRVGWCF